jgi:hypothetical protein
MPRFAVSVLVVSLAVTCSANAAPRTFVSTSGHDANPCSLAAPCRSFAKAVSKADSGGDVIVLDSGGYGPVTIGQAVSIVAPAGIHAGITVPPGATGVTVAAGPSDKVMLRGLSISGQDSGHGIVVESAGQTYIHRSDLSRLTFGIRVPGGGRTYIRDTTSQANTVNGLVVAAASGEVFVEDSRFDGNGFIGIAILAGTFHANRITSNANGAGIDATALGGKVITATLIDSTTSSNKSHGTRVSASSSGTTHFAVSRSVSARNGGDGFVAEIISGPGTTTLVVTDSVSVENFRGLVAGGTSTAIVARSTLARNTGADLAQFDVAVLRSSGNNTLTGRPSGDTGGAITLSPPR